MSNWSQQIQDETRHILSLQNTHPFQLNKARGISGVFLKNFDDRFGLISLNSCIHGKYQIKDIDSELILDTFSSVEDLLSANWVID